MAEYIKPLNIVHDVRLNDPNSLENPLITKELVYQFLDKSYEYHNSGGKVEVTPELQKQFDLAFPGLSIADRYQPDNNGWYHKKIAEKVRKQEAQLTNQPEDSLELNNSNMLKAKQQRAANLMNLVNKVLIENGISPENAQELSFNTVSKALTKNPSLVLSNEVDVKNSQNITEGLRPGIEKLKPKPNPDDNKFEGRSDLTEDNAKELQAYMTNQMLVQMEQYNRSIISETANDNEAHYQKMAYTEGADMHASTSIGLKNNIRALRGEFSENKPKPRKAPPTPFDDLLDPLAGKR